MPPPPPPRNLKAIIIGGSVAGLTLAHSFEAAHIPYVLLEARDTIAPQLGASIVVMPNGARVLDQLGLYEGLRGGVMMGLRRAFVWGEDGRLVGENEWPGIVEVRLGYACGICERVKFLRYMHEQLKDKSTIRLNTKVVSIEHGENSVTVTCADGTEFEGDVVIGADGIHSRTRREMQRYAKETGPQSIMERDENCIAAQYTCIFGISSLLPGLNPGAAHQTSSLEHSTLLFIGRDSCPQFFFVSKLPQLQRATASSAIPTFSKAEMFAQLKEHENIHVTSKVKLGNLVKNAKKNKWVRIRGGYV